MKKLEFIKLSLLFAVITTILSGCSGKQSLLSLQEKKDTYCLDQIELAYKNLVELENSNSELQKINYANKSFNILKQAEKQECTSSFLFLAMHYNYGIGTNIDIEKAEYYIKLDKHYRNLPVEQRLNDQGTILNLKKEKE